MLSNLPVVRCRDTSAFFLVSAAVTAGILLWAHHLLLTGSFRGLTPIFFTLFAYFDYYGAMGLLLALVAALFVPSSVSFRPLLRWVGEHPGTVALICTALLAAGALIVYRAHPLAMDEYAQLFQSRVFAAGHLTGRFPPALLDWLIPKGFQDFFLDVSPASGQVASAYWPSFALLLTPFTLLGVPWACNPVISGLTVVAIHRLTLRISGDVECAGLAVLLTAASPVFFGEGISYYSMPAHLLLNCVYALLLLQPTVKRALAAGVVGSVALTLHNPVPHMLFAIPWIIWIVVRRGDRWRLAGALCLGYLPLCLFLGVGWFWFTGHLMHEGSHASSLSGGLNRISIAFSLPSWAVFRARVIGVAKVWVWAVPGLLLLACAGAWKWRDDRACRLLAASAILTLLGYLVVPVDQGHGWGYRYFHSAWLALPILGAVALLGRPASASRTGALESEMTRTFVVACILATFIFGVVLRAVQIRGFMSDDLSQLPAYRGGERHVVLIDARFSFYGADLVQNDPWLRGNVVRMLSHGPAADATLMHDHFPTFRRIYADTNGTVWAVPSPQSAPSRVSRR